MQTTLLVSALMMSAAMAAQTPVNAATAVSGVDLTADTNKGSLQIAGLAPGGNDFCLAKNGATKYWCWTMNGESLTFNYDNKVAGTYYLSANYGTVKNGGVVVFNVNGVDSAPITLTSTTGWEVFALSNSVAVPLKAGKNTITVKDLSVYPAGAVDALGAPLSGKLNAAFNFEGFTVSDAAIVFAAPTTAAPTVATTAAANLGTELKFQAEKPLSFTDSTPGNVGKPPVAYPTADLDVCVTAAGVVPANDYVCYTAITETLTYTVTLPQDADYTFALNYATKKDGANVKVTVDGTELFGKVSTVNTLGWENFTKGLGAKTAALTAGEHTVKLEILPSSVDAITNIAINLDSFSLFYGGAVGAPTTVAGEVTVPSVLPTDVTDAEVTTDAATTTAAAAATTTKAPVAEQAKLPSSGNMAAVGTVFAALSAAAVYFNRQN